MFRSTANKSAGGGGGGSHSASAATSSASPNKHQQSNASTNDNSTSTIREIRSRTSHSTTSSNARQLIANRRQAMSMERLNSSNTTHQVTTASATSMHNINSLTEKEKNSPISGSSNSISGSTASSPSRGSNTSSQGGLNRTASRVSRFRSAKAVFERLSSANSTSSGKHIDRPSASERPKGTVASRYASAAVARGIAAQNNANDNGTTTSSSNTSPRSRIAGKNSVRPNTQDSNHNKSTMNNGVTRSPPGAAKNDSTTHPKPQPRVITTSRRTAPVGATSQNTPSQSHDTQATNRFRPGLGGASSTPNKSQISQPSQAKPPPKDLIDKIVLEIARNADEEHDANCTIQDLSNCDISGIPETLDFDKCFQDVEMMTEEEARKLLSRKSESSACSTFVGNNRPTESVSQDSAVKHSIDKDPKSEDISPLSPVTNITQPNVIEPDLDQSGKSIDSLIPSTLTANNSKFKVRFSDEPVAVYDTHAIEDYDRRNDDIDPVAASAEYEIEKSRERDGMKDSDEEEEEEDTVAEQYDLTKKNSNITSSSSAVPGAVILSGRFTQNTSNDCVSQHDDDGHGHQQVVKTLDDCHSHHNQSDGVAHHHNDHLGRNDVCRHDSSDHVQASADPQQPLSVDQRDAADIKGADRGASTTLDGDDDDRVSVKKEYIGFLEQEVNLKRILEQNLRDLQSQYYETVKQLDGYKSSAETKVSQLEANVAELNNRCETSQNELSDEREQAARLNKELNDIKESSQLLEKKYHRAKRIIKDMQAREESFTRREQLYQQKLDEIEYELGILISTIDKTIYDDGLKYFSIVDTNCIVQQHQTELDVFGLIRQMLNNFDSSKSTQSEQIKQRIVSMLEQQLANLLALSNGATSVSGSITPIPSQNMPTGKKNIVPGDNLNIPLSAISTNNCSSNNNNNDSNKHNQNYNYASHRLSQPNMPHPIGVGGQPTKIFHGLTPIPIPATLNEPSPPQSVNSYPSTNSLNSLNNNNNSQQVVNNNNNNPTPKVRDQSSAGKLHQPLLSSIIPTPAKINTTSSSSGDDNFQPAADIQVPYQTNEWHDKPVSEWTTNQVSTWLLALGLDQYISKFEDRNVNGQSLINLDSTVLKGLGVLNSNDRNLLKKKIRELRTEMEKERKLIEKKMKENLKDKSKTQIPNQSKQSWKKSLLS